MKDVPDPSKSLIHCNVEVCLKELSSQLRNEIRGKQTSENKRSRLECATKCISLLSVALSLHSDTINLGSTPASKRSGLQAAKCGTPDFMVKNSGTRAPGTPPTPWWMICRVFKTCIVSFDPYADRSDSTFEWYSMRAKNFIYDRCIFTKNILLHM